MCYISQNYKKNLQKIKINISFKTSKYIYNLLWMQMHYSLNYNISQNERHSI